jgi:hypothetical protein
MTLDEARAHIGDGVVYRALDETGWKREDGVITSVNDRYVFARYGSDQHSKATDPAALTLLAAVPVHEPALD